MTDYVSAQALRISLQRRMEGHTEKVNRAKTAKTVRSKNDLTSRYELEPHSANKENIVNNDVNRINCLEKNRYRS